MEAVGQLGDQEEPLLPEDVCSRKGQAIAMRSRMNREIHVRICESLGVKLPGATRPDPLPPMGQFEVRIDP